MRNGESGAMAAREGGATAQPRNLPGSGAADGQHGIAQICLVFAAMFTFIAIWLEFIAVWFGLAEDPGGHLTPSALQWIFGTPFGLIAVVVLGSLVGGALPALFLPRFVQGYRLAWAVDVTGAPVDTWPALARARMRGRRGERWLGRGAGARVVSVLLLALAAAVVSLALFGLVAALDLADAMDAGLCTTRACPPEYPMFAVGAACEIGCGALTALAAAQWLRRAEAACGSWLRARVGLWTTPLCYIRRPGMSAEAAVEAIGNVAGAERVPLARLVALSALAIVPMVAVYIGCVLLGGWLRLDWLPG